MDAFFKNAIAYRLTGVVSITDEALATKPHREPATQELCTYGFIKPAQHSAELVEIVQCGKHQAMLIMAKKTERILPGAVVRDELKKKVDAIEAEQQRKVYKKERDQLKDEIIQAFLPRAFLRHKVTRALFVGSLVLIDSTSQKAAEDLLSTLRECLGSLPVRPVCVKIAPSATMTDWLKNEKAAPDFFALDECELRDTQEDGGTVRCKRQDLTADETKEHLSAGKQVTKLALAWQDKLSFVLDDNLTIKRLRFEDLLADQAEADGGDDVHGQFVASLTIMAGTMVEFIAALLEALGGEEIPAGI